MDGSQDHILGDGADFSSAQSCKLCAKKRSLNCAMGSKILLSLFLWFLNVWQIFYSFLVRLVGKVQSSWEGDKIWINLPLFSKIKSLATARVSIQHTELQIVCKKGHYPVCYGFELFIKSNLYFYSCRMTNKFQNGCEHILQKFYNVSFDVIAPFYIPKCLFCKYFYVSWLKWHNLRLCFVKLSSLVLGNQGRRKGQIFWRIPLSVLFSICTDKNGGQGPLPGLPATSAPLSPPALG